MRLASPDLLTNAVALAIGFDSLLQDDHPLKDMRHRGRPKLLQSSDRRRANARLLAKARHESRTAGAPFRKYLRR
jgi:hypothetical protein